LPLEAPDTNLFILGTTARCRTFVPARGQTVRVPQQAIHQNGALARLRRPTATLAVVAMLSSGCYSYETRSFEITIPETAESSVVVARDGTLITTLVAPQNRTSARRLDEIPELVRNAVIAIEDERFYHHDGVDLKAIVRAARTNLEAGGISQGGSTLTQQ